MDAFAVAISKGLSMQQKNFKDMLAVGGFFGVFQAAMPLIGYLLGIQFEQYIASVDHWVALIVLSAIGVNMIRESRDKSEAVNGSIKLKSMIVLSLATSIDALAIGVTFAFLQVNIFPAVLMIGIVTLIISLIGVRIGNVFGVRFKSKAEIAGGGDFDLNGDQDSFGTFGNHSFLISDIPI